MPASQPVHPGFERFWERFAAAGPRGPRHGGGPRGWAGGPFGFARAFGGGGGFFGPGPRRGRGDVRAAILALLAERPMHGYQIIQELEERSEGAWRPSAGSIYPNLQQLEDEGLVRQRPEEGSDRRVYELTDAGRERAEAGPKAPWEAARAEQDTGGLRQLVFQVAGAAMQVAHAGSAEQVELAEKTLRETRRTLYRILAEDDSEPTEA